MKKYFIVVAGGSGVRMGSNIPKQFIELQGIPILMHTINRLYQSEPNAQIILVLPQSHKVMWDNLVKSKSFTIPVLVTCGGETRFHSVKNGLELVSEEEALVAVHDGVRPFVDTAVVQRCFDEAEKMGAAIPVIKPVESVRLENMEGRNTPYDRNRCYLVQTPQTFKATLLKKAYRQEYKPTFTDDASVVESISERISLVEGNKENIKITTQFDLKVAKALLEF